MKIAFFELEPWEEEYLRKRINGHSVKFFKGHLDAASVVKARGFDCICTFIYSKIDKKILSHLQKLKLLVTMSTGYDHIDIKECKKRGVTVCNVPEYGSNTVAEHTFALMLALSRNIVESVERTRRGNFSLDGLRGFDLNGKTLGVVGVGRIGRNVIKMAKAFNMNVLANDCHPKKGLAKELGFAYATLPQLLAKADIITLHAPLNKETYHLINKHNIKRLKKGVVLINTARGGLVETETLLEALKKGIISYAGLDVLEEECFIKEEKQLLSDIFKKECDIKTALEQHVLLTQDNVIITPHNAFNSVEALQRILDTTVKNIYAFARKKPVNTVPS